MGLNYGVKIKSKNESKDPKYDSAEQLAAGKREGLRKEKFRKAAAGFLRQGADAAAANASRVKAAGAQQMASFDRNTETTRADMRAQAARSLAASQGRGMRQNIGSMLDTGLQSGQSMARFASDRDAERAQLDASIAMRQYGAEKEAAQQGFAAAEGEFSLGTQDSDTRALISEVLGNIPKWAAEAEAAGKDPDTYIQQMISSYYGKATSDEARVFLQGAHAKAGEGGYS